VLSLGRLASTSLSHGASLTGCRVISQTIGRCGADVMPAIPSLDLVDRPLRENVAHGTTGSQRSVVLCQTAILALASRFGRPSVVCPGITPAPVCDRRGAVGTIRPFRAARRSGRDRRHVARAPRLVITRLGGAGADGGRSLPRPIRSALPSSVTTLRSGG
jgi:hypothetical protein